MTLTPPFVFGHDVGTRWEYETSIEVDGVRLPALAVERAAYEWWAFVPMENGWVAYVLAFPRPDGADETEFAVAFITAAEAREKIETRCALRHRYDWDERERGEWGLLDVLRSAATRPSPESPDEAWQ